VSPSKEVEKHWELLTDPKLSEEEKFKDFIQIEMFGGKS
jgi:hypothetical protein